MRAIFETYLAEESLLDTARALNARGWTTKSWTTRRGRSHAGRSFDKANLHSLLTNVVYTGRVATQGMIVPGEQEAIVPVATFERVQAHLRHHGRTGGRSVRNRHGALLRDLLRCAPCDAAMGHAYTVKRGKRYRYYVCQRAQKQGWGSCPTKAIPAGEVERFVVERIRGIGADPALRAATVEAARREHAKQVRRLGSERRVAEKALSVLQDDLARTAGAAGADASRLLDLTQHTQEATERLTRATERVQDADGASVDEAALGAALTAFGPVWAALAPKEQARVLRLLVERVLYDGGAGTLAVTFRPTGIRALAAEGAPAAGAASPAEARR